MQVDGSTITMFRVRNRKQANCVICLYCRTERNISNLIHVKESTVLSSTKHQINMRMLLPSKKTCLENERRTRARHEAPKRTLTSSWNIRNDSSNISSVLHPEIHAPVPKAGVAKKEILSENTCYCKDKKIKPKLMSRPKSCLSLDGFRNARFVRSDLVRRSLGQSPLLHYCWCGGDSPRDQVDSTDVKLRSSRKTKGEPETKSSGLKYTEPRKEYNLVRQEQNREAVEEIRGHNESFAESKGEGDYSVSTIMGTKPTTTKTSSSYGSDRTVDDVNDFRKEHYFETHSTEDLEKISAATGHTCVHQFRLDDRLLPEPLNVDAYGRSRCSICARPMQGETMQLSKSYFGDRPSCALLRKMSKQAELGLVPRSISIGGNRSKVELRVEAKERSALGSFVGKMRRPQYFNTFALRQQRMSC